MRTIETKIYTFDELSEAAKQRAINDYNNNERFEYLFDDANNTIRAFCDIFPAEQGGNSLFYLVAKEDNAYNDNVRGERLQRYIWNNYGRKIFTSKYYGVKANYPIKHNRIQSITYRNGNTFNGYYSAIFVDNLDVLTGVCYDDDLLKPIYEFLNQRNPENIGMEELIKRCGKSLEESVTSEIEYLCSNESVSEALTVNDYEFFEDGKFANI